MVLVPRITLPDQLWVDIAGSGQAPEQTIEVEVGLHRCHGRLDGRWRDVLLVERLLGDAHRAAAVEEQPPQVQIVGERSA